MVFQPTFGGIDIPQKIYDRIHKQEKIKCGAIVYNGKIVFKYQITAPRRIVSGMEKFTCLIEADNNGEFIESYGEASGCGYDKKAHCLLSACKRLYLDIKWTSCYIIEDIARALELDINKCVFVSF